MDKLFQNVSYKLYLNKLYYMSCMLSYLKYLCFIDGKPRVINFKTPENEPNLREINVMVNVVMKIPGNFTLHFDMINEVSNTSVLTEVSVK